MIGTADVYDLANTIPTVRLFCRHVSTPWGKHIVVFFHSLLTADTHTHVHTHTRTHTLVQLLGESAIPPLLSPLALSSALSQNLLIT